jgi:hypothetical protein
MIKLALKYTASGSNNTCLVNLDHIVWIEPHFEINSGCTVHLSTGISRDVSNTLEEINMLCKKHLTLTYDALRIK